MQLLGTTLFVQIATCGALVRKDVDDKDYTLVMYMHNAGCDGAEFVCQRLRKDTCSLAGETSDESQLYAKLTDEDGKGQNMEVVSCMKDNCECDGPPQKFLVTPPEDSMDFEEQYTACHRFPKFGYSIKLIHGHVNNCISEKSDIALGRWDVKMPVPDAKRKEGQKKREEATKKAAEQRDKAAQAKFSTFKLKAR